MAAVWDALARRYEQLWEHWATEWQHYQDRLEEEAIAEWERKQPKPERPPSPHILACKRYPVVKLYHNLPAEARTLPDRFIEDLEQNQKIRSCCRHPENHEIEAWYSSWEDAEKGIPDIYINHCTCGRKHTRFMVGGGPRPVWDVR